MKNEELTIADVLTFCEEQVDGYRDHLSIKENYEDWQSIQALALWTRRLKTIRETVRDIDSLNEFGVEGLSL